MVTIGTVRTIARYPVKSMAGEVLPSVSVGLQGLPGDRAYAFVQDGRFTPFPWFTAPEYTPLLRYQTRWDRSTSPATLYVDTPEGIAYPVDSDELRMLIEERSGRGIHLHTDHRGNHDV